jgi:hypothetical protein
LTRYAAKSKRELRELPDTPAQCGSAFTKLPRLLRSVGGPKRHPAAVHQFGRFPVKADITRV